MHFLYHPMVIHFPIALWTTSFLFDVLYGLTRQSFFSTGSRYLVGVGLLGAAVSIVAGFVDYRPLVAQGVGQAFIDMHRLHSFVAYGTTALYALIFWTRLRWRAMPMAVYVTMGLAGAILITLTGYLGGEVRGVM
ncbi:MAG TPA: DUF2231 domain-containing protein [bacterium]|jgi:uncharacterized membrane protein|nr:DUF2231 domain-containing protein [bacterium]